MSRNGVASVTYEIDTFNATSLSYQVNLGTYYANDMGGKFTAKGTYVKSHTNSYAKKGKTIYVTLKLNPKSTGTGSYSSGLVYGS